ncbi:TPM domain-containing protein, partial [Mycolicibacterium insubricum]|nr:TPM domain-containing protein [Mycolicibacterium insubricum]
MRILRLLAALLAVLLTACAVAPAAVADTPARLISRITDNSGVLSASDRASVTGALNDLYDGHRIKLWVVYVDDFSGQSALNWAKQTMTVSDFGDNDALLAVAVKDRSVAFQVPVELTGGTAAPADVIRRNYIEPALSRDDWAGAAITAAQQLGTVGNDTESRGNLPLTTVALILGLVVLAMLGLWLWSRRSRRRRRAAELEAAATRGSDRPAGVGPGAAGGAGRAEPPDRRRRGQCGAHQQQRIGVGRRGIRHRAHRTVPRRGRRRPSRAGQGVAHPPDPRRRHPGDAAAAPRAADRGDRLRRPGRPGARRADARLRRAARPGHQRSRTPGCAGPAAGGADRAGGSGRGDTRRAAQPVHRNRVGVGGRQCRGSPGPGAVRRRDHRGESHADCRTAADQTAWSTRAGRRGGAAAGPGAAGCHRHRIRRHRPGHGGAAAGDRRSGARIGEAEQLGPGVPPELQTAHDAATAPSTTPNRLGHRSTGRFRPVDPRRRGPG